MIEVFGRGGALKSSWYGDCLPSRDFPMLVDLYRQGRFDLDGFVSETIGLGDVEEAFDEDAPRRGAALRGGALMAGRGSRRSSRRAPSPSTAASGTSRTTSGWSATTTRSWSSTPPTTRPRSSPRSATGGSSRSSAPTVTTTTSTRPSRWPRPRTPRSRCTRPTGCCGRRSTATTCTPTSTWPTAGPFEVAGTRLAVLHTPGHSPGAVCLYAPDLGAVFSGDTLFQGGPGATGRSYSDFPTIIDSIRRRLLTLPPATVVHTGHGAGHHDRRGGAAPGRVDRPWPLSRRSTSSTSPLVADWAAAAGGRRLPRVDARPHAGAGGLPPRVLRRPVGGRCTSVLRRGRRAAGAARDRPGLLDVPVVVEAPAGADEAFPHIYGPLPVAAVVATRVL